MSEKELSAVETELYDRQIRLWGIESQEKLRAANVLIINIRGLGSEIAKNILLSGINSLTILDDGVVTEDELRSNFLLNFESIGQKIAESVLPKAQALNPLVKITADVESLNEKNENFFKNFTIVIGTRLTTEQIISVSTWCRNNKVKFICGDVFGMFGYAVSDFQNHKYYEDRVVMPKSRKRTHEGKQFKLEQAETVKLQGTVDYPELSKVLILPDSEKKARRRNEYYYLMLVLIEFKNKHKRNPLFSKKDEDLVDLKELRNHILKLYQVKVDKLPDEVFELVFDEVVPICSIVGGVIAQEVIKAVSGKEVPINNVFLLNPFTYYGKEETVCN